MKKVFAIFALAALTACGGNSASNETTDSTAVAADSVAVDSTATVVTDSTSVVNNKGYFYGVSVRGIFQFYSLFYSFITQSNLQMTQRRLGR